MQEHTGIPTLAAVCEARRALEDIGVYGEVQLIIAGGIRDGVDAAKAIALGADAIYIGTAALIALNCNRAIHEMDYHAIGAAPYHCHHCHTGRCPVGITTQDPELMKRLDIDEAVRACIQPAASHDARNSDAGARLREKRRSSSGAGRHGGAHRRSVHDLRHPAGRHSERFSAPECPFCWLVPNAENAAPTNFAFGGEVKSRPRQGANEEAWFQYIYTKANEAGEQKEWWFHRNGCRKWFQALRDTRTNTVLATWRPE